MMIICCLALLPAGAFAQATDGNVVGTVLDQSGAVVPKAHVQLRNLATNVKSDAQANDTGEYRFNNVPIGTYELTADAQGFSPAKIENVAILLNQTATANVTLKAGAVSTSVEVSAAPATIDTTTAQVQSTYSTRQALELPMADVTTANPTGVLNLSLLSAGVTSSGGLGYGIGPSVGGQRPDTNSFNVEGVDNNRKDVTGPIVGVPNEAVGELTVLQNQFAAEFGHSSGGQFNETVKSGTNNLHGSLYEYFENRKLNALDQAFFRSGITEKPRFDQNRYGGTIGGPIKKDKLFYFVDLEKVTLGQVSTPPLVFAPTAAGYAALNGLTGISQTNLSVLEKYVPPAPTANEKALCVNCPTIIVNGQPVQQPNVPIGILPVPAPNYQNFWNLATSMDYNVSDRDQLRGRYIYNKSDTIDNNPNLPIFFTNEPVRGHLFSLGYFHTFSPTLTNELRLAFNRFSQFVNVGNFSFPGLDQFPNLTLDELNSLQVGPDPNGPQSSIFNNYQLVDNLSSTVGAHTFKFGYDGRKLIAPESFVQRSRGDYEWSSLQGYLTDQGPDVFGERSVGVSPYYGNQIANYLYATDQWRIHPNLSLDVGVRYEYTTVPYTARLQRLNALASVPGVIEFNEPKPQKNAFAPRIGLAYSPGSSGTTSIRAGFGMAYSTIFDNLPQLSLPPQFNQTVDVDTSNPGTNFLANGGILPTPRPPTDPVSARAATSNYIPDQTLPYSINWSLGVQRVFAKDYTLEVRYLGTRGVHLLTQTRLNRIPRVTATRNLPTYIQASSVPSNLDSLPYTVGCGQFDTNGNPTCGADLAGVTDLTTFPTNTFASLGFTKNIVSFQPDGDSIYHGLATQLTRRLTNGLQFVTAYTWSHSIDNSTAELFSTVLSPRRAQDFQNLGIERANSALDRRHRFSFSSIWDAPWYRGSSSWALKNLVGNVTLTGTYIAESPEYATIQSGLDSNMNGDSAGDRTIINNSGTPKTGSGVNALLNSAGYIVAYQAIDPNAQYIVAGKGAYATGGRNTFPLQGINNVDLSAIKRFAVSESKTLDLRFEAFNLFNHPQFTPGTLDNVNLTTQTTTRAFLIPSSATFGQYQSVFSSNPRVVQLVARFQF